MVKFICYSKCTTCQKAKKWLDDSQVEYEFRDIKLDNPTLDELIEWHKKSGLPLKKFFNTSGLLYKSLDLKNKLSTMSEDEMLKLLSSDGMLVKRPLLIGDIFVLVGFKEDEWNSKVEGGIGMDTHDKISEIRAEYKEYLIKKHPDWSESTLSTHLSDAYFIWNNTVIPGFWKVFLSNETMKTARDSIYDFLKNDSKSDRC